MKNKFTVSTVLSSTPEKIYRAWLSTDGHTAMTGSTAKVDPRVGGTFSAWDGYISGKTLELEPYTRIVQAWRTSEFPDGSADSRLEILLEAVEGGTKLTLTHSKIPEGQTDDYETGWDDSYFKPMKEYFTK